MDLSYKSRAILPSVPLYMPGAYCWVQDNSHGELVRPIVLCVKDGSGNIARATATIEQLEAVRDMLDEALAFIRHSQE